MARQTLFQKLVSQRAAEAHGDPHTFRYSLYVKIAVLAFTIISCALFFVIHIEQKIEDSDKNKLTPGYVWTSQTLKADFTFPVYKPNQLYTKEINDARDNQPYVFIIDQSAEYLAIEKIQSILELVKSYNSNMNPNFDAVSDKAIKPFANLSEKVKIAEISKINRDIKEFLHEIFTSGFVNINTNKIETQEIIVRIAPNKIYPLNKINLKDRGSFLDAVNKFANEKYSFSTELVIELLSKNTQPNLTFSEELTEKARELAEKSVPKTSGIVRKGDIIIRKGDIITDDIIPKIYSYHTSKALRNEDKLSFLEFFGSVGHSLMIIMMLILYLFFIRKRIFYDNYQLIVLFSLLVIVSVMSWLSVEIPSSYPLEYLICIPAFSMLAAILFDSRTAFYVNVTMVLLLTGIRGNDYATGISMLFAGTLAAYTVKDIQSRTQMFQSIFYIFMGLSFAILVFGWERSTEMPILIKRIVFALINSVIAPLLTFGLLFILERVSNIATDLRIKEYDNLNHPLLLKMNESAPGTYQHTLAVALLSERCAQAINANPLLAKVGAYYHDIGKIAKAEYFTENQMEMGNKHDLLAPKRSASAIREHVNDGVELAKQYKIPQRIIDFIPMHHGTTIIKHFYAKALEEAAEKGINVKEDDFRYPGPKPNTKETAILMICDSSEAISRVQGIDKVDIEERINQNIREKILDGQFNNCDLTMADIEKIKDTIAKSLLAKSHQRIKYKEIPKHNEIEGAEN